MEGIGLNVSLSLCFMFVCGGKVRESVSVCVCEFASLLGLAASAASPSPPAIILPARARRISGQP